MANTIMVKPNPTSALTNCASTSQPAKAPPHHLPSAAITAPNTSDTINRKAIPRIMPNDSSRVRSSRQRLPDLSSTGARQIRSSALCSSPKTAVAPMINTAMPISVAAMPSVGLLTLTRMPSTALAASAPIKPRSSPNSWPRTASAPKNKPATEMTINISGASEKIV